MNIVQIRERKKIKLNQFKLQSKKVAEHDESVQSKVKLTKKMARKKKEQVYLLVLTSLNEYTLPFLQHTSTYGEIKE